MTQRIVLASGSPRRRELLGALGVTFEVDPADADEATDEHDPIRVAEDLALLKAHTVAARHLDAVVIGSDTVVALDGTLLGKPADADEARTMLRSLRGRLHEVVTGVAVIVNGIARVTHSRTVVAMRDYADEEIEAFIATGSAFDKSGGYASQDPVFAPTARIEGCPCGVVGLPLWTLRALLHDAGVEVAPPSLDRCAGCLERR
ncbi:MAG: Maf family protein [Chloroflexota bacterium]